jgi:hypothetical protein
MRRSIDLRDLSYFNALFHSVDQVADFLSILLFSADRS